MFSSIHLLDCTGVIFQPELHVETTSTKEVPFLSSTFLIHFFNARLHFRTAPADCAD
jgi:hypothetical protein